MSNHSAKFASAIFATILAGTSFAAVPESGAKTADNCLSGPKGTTPAGHHWYYRFDRATKRQCWYSRDEREKAGRATPQDLSPPSKTAPPSAAASNPVPPLQSPTVSKSVADARAELRVEPRHWRQRRTAGRRASRLPLSRTARAQSHRTRLRRHRPSRRAGRTLPARSVHQAIRGLPRPSRRQARPPMSRPRRNAPRPRSRWRRRTLRWRNDRPRCRCCCW